ncbi:MAG: carbohydrate kinase family protein [Bacteroidales bacterium]|nr:carbohydrate kinase family protein [Bacteroidales bacterium]
MRICVIGGANADIIATSFNAFVPGDSNPGTVRLTAGGVGRNIAHNLALLGDEVVFLTQFGGDDFGQFTAESCRKAHIDISLCDYAASGTHSCFLSINDCDGEMVGGVADMAAADGITLEWLAKKMEKLGDVDVFVADANIPVETLAYLIDHADKPLYVDAVSGAKAAKIKEAMAMSVKKHFFTLKCNQIESAVLSDLQGVNRRYVSLGADGLEVVEGDAKHHFPALPCHVVNVTGAGDALMAGIIHAGPQATIEEAAHIGLLCAKNNIESLDTVNQQQP